MKTLTHEQYNRLTEIKEELLQLLNEANKMVRGTSEENRAHSYWFAHIRMALDDEHGYLGSSMCTLQGSIDALDPNYTKTEEEDDAA